jgi:hypothetical protein
VQIWTNPTCSATQMRRIWTSLLGLAGFLEALIAFCSESSGILTAAHLKALDMYQVGVPMTTSSCLTTKPNFL